ncbi:MULTISPECIES: hypothetical protein [unclassified Nocardioides]|uniref:hypothetical protein n=1 Tax=unclassified Nocardioides TaxID=2615069 RepID=UPI0009F14C13|nr:MULTISPECIES: hypothetical protein [unclassified Nocardioides]GAW52152.1 uncharacterized protein PD653B2_4502 [Nocardioides sp. PD653-B2]GAW57540.1 uncharacterized protein PD653_4985 [Nocardioides sp. PD653]
MSSGGITLAHGIGGAKDLPISPELAIAGATAALVISFTVLAIAWRTPRYDAATSGRPAPDRLASTVDSAAWRIGLRTLGMALFLYVAAASILGKDLVINPVFGVFYVWWWVGMVPLSLLLGPVWKAISPVRTINLAFAKVSGSDPERGILTYPERLGHWPAAVGLFAFVWLELVYPFSTELGPVRLWCAAYVALMLIGGALFGNTFYERADPFEVYSTLASRLSIWGRRGDVLVIRSPLANLDTTPVRPGLVAVVAVLFGSTAFDSFKDSARWVQFIQGESVSPYVMNNIGLLAFCVGVGLIFALGCVLTGLGDDLKRTELPDQLAHSVVPIIIGYIVAHYLSYLVEVGQLTLIQLSDPFSNGSNYLGTGNLQVSYWLSYHPTLLANIKVTAVVVGHVLGVIAAHDRAIKILPPRHQLTGQLPLLFAMIAFTVGGLYLLFAA